VQFEDCTTCDSTLEVCGILSVANGTMPEEEPEGKRKMQNIKATFLDALKGLEATTKYICQFDTENGIIVMFSNVESELYSLRGQKKKGNNRLLLNA
jgi:hypothetical protein